LKKEKQEMYKSVFLTEKNRFLLKKTATYLNTPLILAFAEAPGRAWRLQKQPKPREEQKWLNLN
jgi:hypothetical protein